MGNLLQATRGWGRYGALARLAGLTGAEWSLFCPGIGIALDSSPRVIVLFVRPAVGSAGGAARGVTTEPAAGTDGSGPPTVAGVVSCCGAVVTGAGGDDGALLQAVITSTTVSSAAPCIARVRPIEGALEEGWTGAVAKGVMVCVPAGGAPHRRSLAAMDLSPEAPIARRTSPRQRRQPSGGRSANSAFVARPATVGMSKAGQHRRVGQQLIAALLDGNDHEGRLDRGGVPASTAGGGAALGTGNVTGPGVIA